MTDSSPKPAVLVNVVLWTDGSRSVFFALGQQLPDVVHRSAWVGYGAADAALDMIVTRNIRPFSLRTILGATGKRTWWEDVRFGTKILELPDLPDWSFAKAFLAFWIGYVFGCPIEMTELNGGDKDLN